MTERDDYARARQRATSKYLFYSHAGVYAAVMLLLVAINLVTSPGVLWFIWPMMGWGLAVALHFVQAFLLADRNAMIDRLSERELGRSGKGGTGGP